MNEVIEVNNLYRDYTVRKGWIKPQKNTVHAVNGITFNVKRGEIFGLLGENGAGKTTTIKMLITLLAPTSGECRVLNYNTYGEEKYIRNRINFIFGSEMGVYRRLSAYDNLKYFANLYNIKSDISTKRIRELLNLVGLTEKADVLVENYSKGMVQRLQIARGLLNEPEVLFMDEPTIGLDPIGAQNLRDIIQELKKQEKTILLTTHYMHEAEMLCDNVAIMKAGKIVAMDSPEKLKKNIGIEQIGDITLEDAYLKIMGEN